MRRPSPINVNLRLRRICSRSIVFLFSVVLGVMPIGCNRPNNAIQATPQAVLDEIKELKGRYRLDERGRVIALDLKRSKVNDGDLEFLRSTPAIQTITLRGVSVVGGKLTSEGLKPLEAVHELRRLDLSANTFRGSLKSLSALKHLNYLSLQGTNFGDEALADVSKIKSLRKLIAGKAPTSSGIDALCGSSIEDLDADFRSDNIPLLGRLKTIRRWRITYGSVQAEKLSAFSGWDQLENIWIESAGDCPPEAIAALRTMKSLRKILITGSPDSACSILTAIDSLPHLEKLEMHGVRDLALDSLPSSVSLTHLDLSRSKVGSGRAFENLTKLPNLGRLSIHPDGIDAEVLERISQCPNLEHLELGLQHVDHVEQNPKRHFVASDFRPLFQRTPLKRLNVSRLGFGDELITEALAAKQLEVLEIEESPLTDEGFKKLKDLRNLRYMNLSQTGVTGHAAKELQTKFLPRCEFSDNWCCGCMWMEPLIKNPDEVLYRYRNLEPIESEREDTIADPENGV